MVIQKEDLKGSWGLSLPAVVLAIYFFLLYPAVKIFFPDAEGISKYVYPVYVAFVLIWLMGVRKVSLAELGVSNKNFRQNVLLGGGCGGLVILCLPMLDGLIDMTGMNELELFRDQQEISVDFLKGGPDVVSLLASSLLIPFFKQIFFSGVLVQALLKKYKPVVAIYLAGILFTLAHFKLSLGTFLLGLIAAQFFYLTGTIIAPLLFHASCATAGILLRTHYTRLATLLYFLF